MNSKRVVATLAGASLLVPAASAVSAPVIGLSPDPLHRTGQEPLKVGYSSFTLAPGQLMTSRSEVSVDGEYYHVILYVSTTLGGIGYVPDVTFAGSSNVSTSEFNAAILGFYATNGSDFNDTSVMGSTSAAGSCLAKQDANNINWLAANPSVLVAIRLNRTAFDSLVARNASSLTINVGLNSVASCSSTSGDDK
jgi:hypothetical protein